MSTNAHQKKTTIGERIRRVREERGNLSQAEFAELFSIHKNTLFRIEKGESEPSYRLLQQISMKESISAEWLLHGIGDMDHGTDESVGILVDCIAKDYAISLDYDEYSAITTLAKSTLIKHIKILIESIFKLSPPTL